MMRQYNLEPLAVFVATYQAADDEYFIFPKKIHPQLLTIMWSVLLAPFFLPAKQIFPRVTF